MIIKNNENYFSNQQLNKIIKYLGEDYKPNKLILCENRLDIFKLLYNANIIIGLSALFNIFVWLGKREGFYYVDYDLIIVFIFSENDDGDNKHSKQLYSLHALLHEARHRYQYINSKESSEEDCDNFATDFINNKSKFIAQLMKWKREWTIEEE